MKKKIRQVKRRSSKQKKTPAEEIIEAATKLMESGMVGFESNTVMPDEGYEEGKTKFAILKFREAMDTAIGIITEHPVRLGVQPALALAFDNGLLTMQPSAVNIAPGDCLFMALLESQWLEKIIAEIRAIMSPITDAPEEAERVRRFAYVSKGGTDRVQLLPQNLKIAILLLWPLWQTQKLHLGQRAEQLVKLGLAPKSLSADNLRVMCKRMGLKKSQPLLPDKMEDFGSVKTIP